MNAVMTDALSKTFPQGKKAVDRVSLTIQQGEIYGFLGPNGAGKTTTVKLLIGMLTPSEGSCRVFDLDPVQHPEKVHQLAGVVTEHAQMYSHLTGFDNLLYYGALFGLSGQESRTHAEALLKKLELTDAKDQKLATYSTGMRQRLSLARALIHRPKILFLDEPTSGLDPESAKNVNQMIESLAREEGTTVFLCTHQLRYAQEICNTYGLIDGGVMLATGGLAKLRALVSTGMTVTIHVNDETVQAHVQTKDEIPRIVRHYVENGDRISHVSSQEMTLEEIYFALIERRKGEKGDVEHE